MPKDTSASTSSNSAMGIAKMEEMRTRITLLANSSLESLLPRAEQIETLLSSRFELQGTSLWAKFTLLQADAGLLKRGELNKELAELSGLVLDELNWAITTLWHITRFLELQIPKREDGNNFGVDVLEQCIKTLQDRNNLLAGNLLEIPSMYLGRAQIFEKMAKSDVTLVTKVTKESSEEEQLALTTVSSAAQPNGAASTSGGGKKRMKETTLNEEKTESQARVFEDYRLFLVAHDTKWFWNLRDILRQVLDTYLIVFDTIEKNKPKLLKPKGSGSHHHMY